MCADRPRGLPPQQWRDPGRVLLVALLLSSALPAAAQTTRFVPSDASRSLPGTTVTDILQDRRGFMWFGTTRGLNRYDGSRSVTYRRERGDPFSLPNNQVNALYEDRGGTLWVATGNGVSRYDRALDRFVTYMSTEVGPDSEGRAISRILEDGSGNLWVGGGGLYLLDPETGEDVPHPLSLEGELGFVWVQALHEDSRGRIWIGTHGQGLYEHDPVSGKTRVFRHDPSNPATLPGDDVRAVAEDASGHMWVGTRNNGLARLDVRTGRAERFRHDPADTTSLAHDRIIRLLADRDRGLWIGTETGGLDYFDPETGDFLHNRAEGEDPTRLPTNSIWALHQDRSGALWVGPYAGRLHVARPRGQVIRHYAASPGVPGALQSPHVRGFTEDAAGRIWIATDGGGLHRFRSDGTFDTYELPNAGPDTGGALSVSADSTGGVWFGGWGGGLGRFDPRTERFRVFTAANSGMPEDNVFSVHADRRGRIWVGTWREGLVRYDPSGGTFHRIRFVPEDGYQAQITVIREARDGTLLVGTQAHGLAIVDPESREFTLHMSEPNDVNTLSSDDVRAVLESEPGVIWIGTSNGLDRLHLPTGRITHYSEEQGLPSRSIDGLGQDTAGNLWISTNDGIARMDPVSATVVQYTVLDGLQGQDFNPGAYFQASDGRLFFGGDNGFNVFRPENAVLETVRPPVVLTDFLLFNRTVPIGVEGSPLDAHISEAERVTLSHDQSVFTFEFASLDFASPLNSRYAYRLDGVDGGWNLTDGRTATYTHLPAGEYVFHVRGATGDRIWRQEGSSIVVRILPPWSSTWWFRTLVVLLLAGVAALVAHRAVSHRRRLEAMNARLTEAAERDRRTQQYLEENVLEILGAMQRFSGGDHSVALDVTSEDAIGKLRGGFNAAVADRKRAEEELRQSQKMEAVGRLAGGIAHDFNNLLTIIRGNTDLALDAHATESEIQAELRQVREAAERASGLTRQLLAFSRKQVFQPRVICLNDAVEGVERLLERAAGADARLETALAPSLDHVRADPGQVEQVLLNLVMNARDATPGGGTIRLETANVRLDGARAAHPQEIPAGRYVTLSVRDTGTGMDPETMRRLFEPFFTMKEQGKGTGLGLSTVYGIVAQSGGHIAVESEPGRGSVFTVYVPAVDPETSGPVARRDETDAGGSETLLLVEDEDAVRRLARQVLERAGYEVLEAPNGEEALRITAEYPDRIHLLLTDVVMPGMNGGELAQRFLVARPDSELLYMSGYTEDALVHHGVSSEGAAFLEKPFTPRQLTAKVRELLEPGDSAGRE